MYYVCVYVVYDMFRSLYSCGFIAELRKATQPPRTKVRNPFHAHTTKQRFQSLYAHQCVLLDINSVIYALCYLHSLCMGRILCCQVRFSYLILKKKNPALLMVVNQTSICVCVCAFCLFSVYGLECYHECSSVKVPMHIRITIALAHSFDAVQCSDLQQQ